MLVLRLAFVRHRERKSWFKDRKNCIISNPMMLVWHCLSHLAQIIWVRYNLVSIVEHYHIPPNWWESRNPLTDIWNCSQVLMTFSISFPVVSGRTMGQKDFGELYKSLFGLGMIIVLVDLKCNGQYSRFMHALAICMNFSKHLSLIIKDLRCLQEMWSGPRANKDEHLAIASLNSCLEKRGYSIKSTWGISLRKVVLIGLFSAELYNK